MWEQVGGVQVNRIDEARVLIRVARNLIRVELANNPDLDEPDRPPLRRAAIALETVDGDLYPYAPDMGEAMEIDGSSLAPLELSRR
jgi:hypothetical protein